MVAKLVLVFTSMLVSLGHVLATAPPQPTYPALADEPYILHESAYYFIRVLVLLYVSSCNYVSSYYCVSCHHHTDEGVDASTSRRTRDVLHLRPYYTYVLTTVFTITCVLLLHR